MRRPIALFLPHLRGGGAERVMLDLARGLAERGLAVDLLLVRKEGSYVRLIPEAVRILELGSRRALTSLAALVRYIHRARPAVLLVTLSETSVVALIAHMLTCGCAPVVVRRANPLSAALGSARGKERATIWFERLLLPRASAIIVNSRAVADDLSSSVPKVAPAIHVIRNPVVWPDHGEKASMEAAHPWFTDQTTPTVLSVARLAPPKDYPTLLRAFACVAADRTVRLAVLGEGPQKPDLFSLAKQLGIHRSVAFLGFDTNPFAYMAKARVLVLSSAYESSPNVLVQAMACGTPVIASDCPGGVREILEDGRLGRLFPVGDWRALARAIRETLDAPPDPRALAAKAAEFGAASSIDQYLDVLVSVAAAPLQ